MKKVNADLNKIGKEPNKKQWTRAEIEDLAKNADQITSYICWDHQLSNEEFYEYIQKQKLHKKLEGKEKLAKKSNNRIIT